MITNATTPEFQAVSEAIDELYVVFSKYSVTHPIHGSPLCVTSEDQKRIASKPMRKLSPTDLDYFVFRAMSTWASVDEFKHFLPRILELYVFQFSDFQLVDGELIFSKLAQAQWQRWEEREQQNLEMFLFIWWRYLLSNVPYHDTIEAFSFINGIRVAGFDVKPYLLEWERSLDRLTAIQHLIDLIDMNFAVSKAGFGIVKDHSNSMLVWVTQPTVTEALEEAFFRYADTPIAFAISEANNELMLIRDYLN